MTGEEREGLPEGWAETTLGEVSDEGQYGWTTKAASEGKVKFLRTTDITKGKINWSTVPFCQEIPPNTAHYLLQPGDILISRAGSVGFSYLLASVTEDAVFASYLIRFKPSAEVSQRYLAYFLKSEKYWNQIRDAAAGIALSNVNASKLREIQLPLPPLPEQIRIADKLDALLARVDAGRERLERVPKLVKQLRQAVLSAAVSGELTREWRGGGDAEWGNRELRQLTCKVGSGATPRGGEESYKSKGIPLIRSMNVVFFGFKRDKLAYIDELQAQQLEGVKVEAGDVLLNITGASIGRVTLAPEDMAGARVNQHVCIIRTAAKLSPKYLSFYLSSPGFQDFVHEENYGATRQALTKQQILALDIPLPPLPEQAEIVRRVEALFAIADRLEQRYQSALASFDRLTPALLAKAFRGELVPQDPNDEPASVLLERIRAQRAAEGQKPKRGRGAGQAKAEDGAGPEGAPKRRGRPPKAQAEGTEGAGETAQPKRRGRPPQGAATVEEAGAQLEARKRARDAEVERAEGRRLVGLFED